MLIQLDVVYAVPYKISSCRTIFWATSPAVNHEFNKLGFDKLGFNDLISSTPFFQQPLDSTALRFNNTQIQQQKTFNNTHLQLSFDSTTLGLNDPWIQQTWIQQPLDSITLNFIILGFNKLEFNDPWIQRSSKSTSWIKKSLDSTTFNSTNLNSTTLS